MAWAWVAPLPPEEVSLMMWYWSDGTPWWGWVLMCVGMIAFWAAVIGAMWYAVTHATRPEPPRRERSPEQILDERFARGELDADEYAQRRDALRVAKHERTPVHTTRAS
jgi:putative membrane protein